MLRLPVLIIEDHPIFASALSRLLAEEGFEVKAIMPTAESGCEFLRSTTERVVVLCDLALPDSSDTGICARLLAVRGDAIVIMLTASSEPECVANALKAGAAGFLTKFTEPAQMIALIDSACAGGSVLDPCATQALIESLRHETGSGPLTERERAVLELLDQGLTTKAVATKLYVSTTTVKTHVVRAGIKLGAGERPRILAEARRRGLLRVPA